MYLNRQYGTDLSKNRNFGAKYKLVWKLLLKIKKMMYNCKQIEIFDSEKFSYFGRGRNIR